jgi:hypothetical protein
MLTKRIVVYLIYIVIISTIGLLTRSHAEWFPNVVAEYGGDTLWAALLFFLLRIILPKFPLSVIVKINLVIGFFIELQQLLHTPWLMELRQTEFGKIFLGQVFLWSDLFCYALGTLLAWATIWYIEKYLLPETN